jgi:ribosomal protein S18 acetylase RimI-like enzyme
VTVRPATEADLAALQELHGQFLAEVRPPDYDSPDPERDLRDLEDYLRGDFVVLVAEDDGRPVGFALGRLGHPRLGLLVDLFVTPDARRRGHASALVGELASRLGDAGAEVLELDVQPGNTAARAVFERWGFATARLTLAAPVDQVAGLTASASEKPASIGSTHVQTDDETSVQRAVTRYLPRLGGSAHTEVAPPRNGWITIYDELCDRDRAAHRRFAAELSERLGVPAVALRLEEGAVVRYYLFERGRMVDEYLSVPTYFGDVSKADEISLAANPTLAARLTEADPARVRAVVRTAPSTAALPPGPELLAEVAAVLGLETRIER